MAAKTTSYADALLKLIFNGTTIANLADNTVTSPATIVVTSGITPALTSASAVTET